MADGHHCEQEAQLPHSDRATRYDSAMFHEVCQLEMFQTANVTFKAIQMHWQWYHSTGHIRFPVSVPL